MKTAFDWQKECQYIGDVTDKRGRVPEMNCDTATFIRYCEMQKAAAEKAGFHDSATYIGECLDDLRDESVVIKIARTHSVEVPRARNGKPGYAWVNGYTYITRSGGQACADTLANTRHTCAQEWPGAKIIVEG